MKDLAKRRLMFMNRAQVYFLMVVCALLFSWT